MKFNEIPELVYSLDRALQFLLMLPKISEEKSEVLFLSLSARKKLLSNEERAHYNLGRTEMFSRVVIKRKSDFEYGLKKCISILGYKSTKSGLPFPPKCLVVYINVNPCNMVQAYGSLTSELQQASNDAMLAAMSSKTPNLSAFHNLDSRLMAAIQKSKGRRGLLDIDFDIDKSQAHMVEEFSGTLNSIDVRHAIIETQGGFHVILKRDDLSKNVRIDKHISQYHKIAKADGGEVVFNSNGMVPLPGTLQGGFEVKILKSNLPLSPD